MSNIQSEQHSLTVQVIVQRVRFEYHAPDVTSRGLGQLAGALRKDLSQKGSREAQSPTASLVLENIPYNGGSYSESDLARINQNVLELAGVLQAQDPTTVLVNQWYESLKALQRAALAGRKQAAIEPSVLREIEEQMKPINLGDTWRVKIQARWWYPEMSQGMHPCQSGGYAKTVVLRTLYLGANQAKDSEQLSKAVQALWGKKPQGVVAKAAASTVIFDDRGTYVGTRVKSGGTIVESMGQDGKPKRTLISRDQTRASIAQRTKELSKLNLMDLSKRRNVPPPSEKKTE